MFNNNNQNNNNNRESILTRAPFLTPTVTITVILSFQALTGTPRSPQHAPLSAQAVHRALPLRRNVSDLLPVKQLRVLHVPHNRQHALPRNTHSATLSCRLSSTIMSATPNAYWRTCSMRCYHPRIRLAVMKCISSTPFRLEQTLTSSRSTAWCCEWLSRSTMRVKFSNVRGGVGSHPRSAPHTSPRSFHSPTHKVKDMGMRTSPLSARTRTHAAATSSTSHRNKEPRAQHTHGRNERHRVRPVTQRNPLALAALTN
ncbi:hypothetical protein TCDM_10066 [Trypanosoma cruzi Dm28c]|uniref:Uncharacterized protein n=1 Tax=Trypanosoma cruzi Dm28c TaxID=1416333 RepID=V5ANH8_TRYCR|nr:hypothetical protein TCDM_10066 [Trypanosoma cruzi Dm28c]